MNQEQKHQLNKLMDHREEISKAMFHIERILKTHFLEQYADAYQHWIPQILTALNNDLRWLPRGQLTLQDTIDRIKDDSDTAGGVSKFIK